MNKLNSKNYCFIIPTYNPNKRFNEVINNILGLNVKIFIFDNNSQFKENLIFNHKNIEIKHSKENLGYAFGINYFIKKYISKFDWFCMLDQDSMLNSNYIGHIINKFDFYKDNIGLIGTNIKYKNLNKNILKLSMKTNFHEKKTLICSGTFINKNLIEKFGYLKDEFFMEYIDVEYCLRMEKNGYTNYITSFPFLVQEFGNNEIYKIFGKKISVDNHKPERYYYRAKNLKYCVKNYFFYLKKETLIHIYNFLKMYLKIIIFEDYKIKKTYLILKGFLIKS